MEDNEQEGLLTGLHSDPRVLVAATVATLVLATGSAFIWRSNRIPSKPVRNSGTSILERTRPDPDPGYLATASPGENHALDVHFSAERTSSEGRGKTVLDDRLTQDTDSKDSKSSRSKERRRRGKDPLKEILKGGKRVKGLVKSSRQASDTDGGGATITTSFPHIPEPSERSRDASVTTSSRSVSSRASSIHETTVVNSSDLNLGQGEDSKSSNNTDDCNYPSTPAQTHTQLQPSSLNLSSRSDPPPHNESTFHDSEVPKPLNVSASSSSSSSSYSNSTSTFASTSSSESAIITTNTTPHTSPASSIPSEQSTSHGFSDAAHIHPSQSMPSYLYSNPSARQKLPSSWDWDGHTTPTVTTTNDTTSTYRKPPRFRPKSRVSNSGAVSPVPLSSPMPTSVSMPYAPPFTSTSNSTYIPSPVDSPTLPSALLPRTSRPEMVGDTSSPFTFASLNALQGSSPGPGPPISPGPNRNLHANGYVNSDGNNPNTPRCIPTPRRTPTPSQSQPGTDTSTPPSSLSMQTQISSLTGALEAARMREEKARADAERYAKESEIMRWEGVAWRRREAELQTQIHHLLHQVQGYAAVFASMPQTSSLPHSSSASHLQGGNSNSNGITIPNQHFQNPNSPLSLPQSPQSHLQMLAPNGMFSPTSLPHPNGYSPFFGYSTHSNSQTQVNTQAQTQQAQQSNLLSMSFHLPSTTNGSMSGSSSVGSLSPDLGSSPTSAPMVFDRGRRRTRTRTQTANARFGGMVDGDGDGVDGWIEMKDGGDGEDGDGENVDEDEDVNEFLADAILKRPDSIRVGSNRERERRREQEELERQPEFTFASISDLGNVNRSTEEEKEQARGGGNARRKEIVLHEDGNRGVTGNRGDIMCNADCNVRHGNRSEPMLHVDVGLSRTIEQEEHHPAG